MQDNEKYARELYEQAKNYLDTAKEKARSPFKAAEAMYAAQTCVELTLKAVLMKLRGEYPREHDVGGELFKLRDDPRISDHIRGKIPRARFISRQLHMWREPSLYGYDEEKVSPKEIFNEKDAEFAIRYADEVYFTFSSIIYG